MFEALQKNEYIRDNDLPRRAKSGRPIDLEFVSNVYLMGGEKVIYCNIRDITDGKQLSFVAVIDISMPPMDGSNQADPSTLSSYPCDDAFYLKTNDSYHSLTCTACRRTLATRR